MLIIPKEGAFLPVKCILPPELLPWINYQDSLTERLKDKAGHARLQVLGQSWGAPDSWDKQVLHYNHEAVFRREIIMWALDEPCWYARTIIPYTTYHAHRVLFNRLEQESIGTLIFSVAEIKRVDIIHYPVDKNSIEYYWLNPSMHHKAKVLWVRLSTFSVADGLPFFLIEMLLPALMRYSN